MTGPRGASLDWDSRRQVTPAVRKSQETRPGLSHGIDLRGKRRGGAPKGERVPLDALPRPEAPADGNIRRCGADSGRLRLSALRLPSFRARHESNKTRARMRCGNNFAF